MPPLIIEQRHQKPLEQQRLELVERKGIGHPDSICDAIMEQASLALCRAYVATFGRILHHNLDKGLLVAGRSQPRLGGGHMLEPMRLVFGDRATASCQGQRLDVGAIVEASARDWMRSHLRWVDPQLHLICQNELKEGSQELTDLFQRPVMGANDTSAAVGYAPLTETERLVLAAERYLNSPEFKATFPETGEDVKVMGYRRDRTLTLTVAVAFVDRCVPSSRAYFARKLEIQRLLRQYLLSSAHGLEHLTVQLNMLDDETRGAAGMYLTVLGTSAEGADGGQVGRGNRVNGVISLNRPMGTEAAAGKNPLSHVGKIYTLLAHELAKRIHASVPGLVEVYVWLGSQIGQPIDQPFITSAQLALQPGVTLAEVAPAVEALLNNELAGMEAFTQKLARGELPVC